MKIRSVIALIGLAISFAVPAFAQEQNTVDPEVRQQIEAVLMKLGEAYNKHDGGCYHSPIYAERGSSVGLGSKRVVWQVIKWHTLI
jgi:hypothetical protein